MGLECEIDCLYLKELFYNVDSYVNKPFFKSRFGDESIGWGYQIRSLSKVRTVADLAHYWLICAPELNLFMIALLVLI